MPEPDGPDRPDPDDRMRRGYARGRERDERIRATLEPLPPGERTTALTVASVVAVLLAISVLIGAATSKNLAEKGGSWPGAILIAALLGLAAWGMWRTRYWAVLGFEAFLAFEIIVAALALIVATTWYGAVICVLVVGFSGWLAWKLIRVMARIQAHDRLSRGGEDPVS
jgi:hypothetical protein